MISSNFGRLFRLN